MPPALRCLVLAASLAASLCPRVAAAEEEVRIVLVTGKASVTVGGASLAVYDAESGERRLLLEPAGRAAIEVEAQGVVVVSAEKGAGRKILARGQRLLVEARDELALDTGVYYGRLEVSRNTEGSGLSVINRLPLETYLLGIVGSEMNPLWPLEALKAQAVAARTYAMQRRVMMRAANKPHDLAATVLSQVYKGAERIRPSVIQAVKETRGEVLAHDHELIEALFHSTCGGRTTSAKDGFGRAVPYLVSKPCEWCRGSHRHRWELSFNIGDLSSRLKKARLAFKDLERFERPSGAAQVALVSKKEKRAASPREVRAAVGWSALYSEHFTAKTQGKKVVISGRGFGHGVGMCQWGAKGMADAGKSYREILEHYYQGARLARIY